MLNSYRVLLTRARKGVVIWILEPDGTDQTMDPATLGRTVPLLTEVGVTLLAE